MLLISFFTSANDTRLSAEYLLDEFTTDLQHKLTKENFSAIRFKVVASRIIKSAVLWDEKGNILFPVKDELSYVSDDLILRDISRFDSLLATANPVRWEQRDSTSFIFHYCRKNIASSCLIVDGIELSAQLDITPEELKGALWRKSAFSINSYAVVLVLLFFLLLMPILFNYRRIRSKPEIDSEIFTLGDLTVKPKQQIGIRDSLTISLTGRDIKLLKYMALHPTEVISKDQLYDAGWGREFLPNSRALEQHIMVLRRKLDPQKTRPPLIETIHGQGYKCL